MFKWLETFRVVYETKSFSKASEILFISQPTVSAQIKQLENEFQTQFFVRNGRKEVNVTPQADILYQRVVNLMDDWEKVYREVQNNQQRIVRCVIGASHTFATYLLPDLLIELYQQFPQIQFSVKMMNSLEVLQAVERHTVDIGFIEKPLSAANITRISLVEDQMVLAGDTEKGPWLVREPSSGVYYYTKRFLEEQNISENVMEIQNNEIIVELLRKGFGCSIISERTASEIPYKRLNEAYRRQFFLIKRDQTIYDELEKCVEYIQRWGESYTADKR
ncbi:LysR family transcriptional regulator [Enterococcus mediterraneensis]|uniref:LysR family transcriptional regulator n=1 Tax=Enterococcus mediterraneensis TaxID=2364791 RepID=UPI000F05138E|nr:LysR family transcriptional regulator [Enterococcus mediterraneensis]